MKNLTKRFNLLRGILSDGKAFTGPFFITLDVTNRCNLRCLGCSYHSAHVQNYEPVSSVVKDIPLALVAGLVQELKALGTGNVYLQGAGEPLLHRDITQIVRLIKAAGMRLTLFTNGTLLTPAMAEDFMAAGLDCFRVSVWAVTQEQYLKMHTGARPDYFDKVLNNIKLFDTLKKQMKKDRPLLHLHYPINTLNYDSLDDFAELARSLGCSGVSFSPLNTVRGQLASFALSPEQTQGVQAKLAQLGKRLDGWSIRHNTREVMLRYRYGDAAGVRTPCYIGWLHARVRIDGNILPCLYQNAPLGNLHEESFSQIWNGKAFRDFRVKMLKHTGRSAVGAICASSYCCHLPENLRVHGVCKWLGRG